jgi:hypothetical protein
LSSGTGSRNLGVAFVSGAFHARFDDEQATRAAARDATSAGFTVGVRADSVGGWLIVCRRRNPFPADEQDRYAGRLRTIATMYGGTYVHFVTE